MTLNRSLQLEILQQAADAYPASLRVDHLRTEAEAADVVRNIYYLHAHKLIEAVFSQEMGKRIKPPYTIMATHWGMDFLANDGGLSAILGTVTVKIHEDTVRQLLTEKLKCSDLTDEEKRPLMQAVRELPGEAIKHLTTRLLDQGMENLPRVTELIHKALHSGLGS